MNAGRIAALISVVVLMTIGQILFKMAAKRIGAIDVGLQMLPKIVANPYLILGVIVYGLTTILWVFVLVDGNLSRSYPFVALTMILVPLSGVVMFGEAVSPGLFFGGILLLIGLAVIAYF